MDLSFEHRLLRFLHREEEDERRVSEDLRALSVGERVLEGECIENATFIAVRSGRFVFAAAENASKFRPGDPVVVGDGEDFAGAAPMLFGTHDPDTGELALDRDPFARGDDPALRPGTVYHVDRRPLGLRGRLHDVVRAGFADPTIAEVLEGRHVPRRDGDRHQRALDALAATVLDDAQRRAGAAIIATESIALVQGPPGTGKTRMLAEVLALLCARGCRIVLSAFTHRAVDNVLLALRRVAPDLPVVKLGNPSASDPRLQGAGVPHAVPRRTALPERGVVGGTCFALAKLGDRERFHYAVFDEAGQLPIPHAIAGMLLARRWAFVGDHRQLPPVIAAHHADVEVRQSVFERLHRCYGSELLDTTYRMNDRLCALVGDLCYGGRLRAAPAVAARRLPFVPGGEHDEVLDPEAAVVLARVHHHQPGGRSPEEARVVVGLVAELIERHGVDAGDIAVIAPFRAQVRLLRAELHRRLGDAAGPLTVDTVERIQGQEREAVVISLAVGDPDAVERRSAFFFSPNRFNVALSRARTKAVLVAAPAAFDALPDDVDALRAAAMFKRFAAVVRTVDYAGSAPQAM